MAAKTPTTTYDPTTAIAPSQIRGGVVGATETTVGDGTTYVRAGAGLAGTEVDDMHLVVRYFSDIDDADTWAHPWGSRLLAVAFEPDDVDVDFVSPHITAAGTVTFQTAAAASNLTGWLWCLVEAKPSTDVELDQRRK